MRISELQRKSPSGFATKLLNDMQQQASSEADRLLAQWHRLRITNSTLPHPADQILAEISKMLHVS